MSDTLSALRQELSIANRILAHEDVLDAFGHVSVRHPTRPDRYLLSRSRGPELVEPSDILEFTLDSEPVVPPKLRLYSERVIHGEIYKARPDVTAVVHHHAPAVLPFCIAGVPLTPVFHLGACMGPRVPFWDQRHEFGDTNLLVVKPAEGASLARALGANAMVLMRRHGATVVAKSLQQLVFRTIYAVRNAEFQWKAQQIGSIAPLSPGEIEKAAELHEQPGPLMRAWEYWSVRLAKREGRAKPGSIARTEPARVKSTRAAKQRKAGRRKTKGRSR